MFVSHWLWLCCARSIRIEPCRLLSEGRLHGHISTAEALPPPFLVIILYRKTKRWTCHVQNTDCICLNGVFYTIWIWRRWKNISQERKKKSEGRKGYMTQNITTSQVINEHCSCCHGNYYHSNVANGIWGRAREICENYCQIQLGSFRLNSAVRPPGPALISYQIKRGIEMFELTPWCESHHEALTRAWSRKADPTQQP